MAMTGGTAAHVHSGWLNNGSGGELKLYVYYRTVQNPDTNQSTIYCGMYYVVPSGWVIGTWTDSGSYVGTTSNTFTATVPSNTSSGTYWIAENKTFTVNHNADGTGTATIYWKWGVNSSWGQTQKPSGSFTITLPQIPRAATITAAPNFTDEDNPTITYSNPAGTAVSSLQACIASTDGMTAYADYRDVSISGTSYTFNLTSAERSALLNACSNDMSMDIKFYLKTVIGSTAYRNTLTKTFTVSNDDINASLGYEEADSKVAGLFGTTDALQKGIVKGYSDVHVFANPTPYEGATIVSSSWTNGVTTLSGNDVTFTNTTGNTFTYVAKDSRGNTISDSQALYMYDYVPVVINSCKFDRVSIDNHSILLNANITFYNGELDGDQNTPTITYTSANGRSGTITSYTTNGNTLTIANLNTGAVLSEGETDTFTLIVSDLLSSDSAVSAVLDPVPTYEAGKSDFQVNGTLYIADTNRANAVNVGAKLATIPVVYVQSTQPTSGKNGDIWFSV